MGCGEWVGGVRGAGWSRNGGLGTDRQSGESRVRLPALRGKGAGATRSVPLARSLARSLTWGAVWISWCTCALLHTRACMHACTRARTNRNARTHALMLQELLRATIARISHCCMLAPRQVFTLEGAEDGEEGGCISALSALYRLRRWHSQRARVDVPVLPLTASAESNPMAAWRVANGYLHTCLYA